MAHAGILRAVLARGDFRRLYATRLASQLADGVFQASLAGAVLFNPEQHTDPYEVAAGFAILLLPYSLVGPFAGVLLDRWSRQRIMVVANAARCGLVALVAAEVAGGVSGVPLAASALVTISVNRFFLAGLSAALPHVVTRPQLVTANSLSTTSGAVATVLGASAIALGIRALVGADNHGYGIIALTSALGYVTSAAVASRFDIHYLGPDADERARRESALAVLRGLVAGARHVAARRPAAYGLGSMGAHRLFYGVSLVSMLLLYRNYFHPEGIFRAGLAGIGQVLGAFAVGTLLAAPLTPPVVERTGKPAWITVTFVVAALGELVLGTPYQMPTLIPLAFLLGLTMQSSKICVDATVQETVDDVFRGRVFSFYDTLFNVSTVAGAYLGAVVLPESGRSYPVLWLVGLGYAGTALAFGVASHRLTRQTALTTTGTAADDPG